jgi:hypothetical protein
LIGAAHERDIAQEYVAAIAPMAYAPGTDADIDAAHEEASERNAEDWNHDPELQATIQHFIDVLFGNLKRNLARSEAERDAALDDWLNKPGPDGHPQTELPPLALWTQLDPERQQAVRNTLANNAWDTRGPRSLIIPVSDADDEEEKEREREKERLRKLEHLPPPADDIEASPVRDLPLPPAAPARAWAPEATPKPVGEAAKPRVARPPQTLAEKLAASREKLRQLNPGHPELSREQPSDLDEALARVRRIIKNEGLRIHGARGRAAEERVLARRGYKPNRKEKVFSPEGSSVPDALTSTELVEVKDRVYATKTRQLAIQAAAAKASGRRAILIVGMKTEVSKWVNDNFEIEREPDLGPQK